MDARRREGRETWGRLLNWDKGSAASEGLAADLLAIEDFRRVDPSHPHGGRDGVKDIVATKGGKKWVAAVFFPRGQKSFAEIRKKFKADLEGVQRNMADGFVFITNQELRLAERDDLADEAGEAEFRLYHLEALRVILDSPRGIGVRSQYLDIEPSTGEQGAVFGQVLAQGESLSRLFQTQLPGREQIEQDRLYQPGEEPVTVTVQELMVRSKDARLLNLERMYLFIDATLRAFANPENVANPIIDVDWFPPNIANSYRNCHEAGLLVLLMHRCVSAPYLDRISQEERERFACVSDRLWRCLSRIRGSLPESESTFLMVGCSHLPMAYAHRTVQICGEHLLQEITHASEHLGYAGLNQAFVDWEDGQPLPIDLGAIVTNWETVYASLSTNHTIRAGFSVASTAYEELAAEAVRAARYEKGLPILPRWLQHGELPRT